VADQLATDHDDGSPYGFGSVWVVSFIRVRSGMCDAYLRELVPVRKKLMSEAQAAGLVLSHKILNGFAANSEDWDVMFMVEYKNWAALDGLKYKLDALNRKVVGSEEEVHSLLDTRGNIRRQLGDKVLQEITFK
jgi:hypothetical protein